MFSILMMIGGGLGERVHLERRMAHAEDGTCFSVGICKHPKVWVLHGEGFITTLCKFAIVDLVAVGKMLLSLLLRL